MSKLERIDSNTVEMLFKKFGKGYLYIDFTSEENYREVIRISTSKSDDSFIINYKYENLKHKKDITKKLVYSYTEGLDMYLKKLKNLIINFNTDKDIKSMDIEIEEGEYNGFLYLYVER